MSLAKKGRVSLAKKVVRSFPKKGREFPQPCDLWPWPWLGLATSGLGLGLGLATSGLGLGLGLATSGLVNKPGFTTRED